jgi:hypothetical protein
MLRLTLTHLSCPIEFVFREKGCGAVLLAKVLFAKALLALVPRGPALVPLR